MTTRAPVLEGHRPASTTAVGAEEVLWNVDVVTIHFLLIIVAILAAE
jgi:hypothetical protein